MIDNAHAGVVHLFYWCNWMHDKLYELGFTEAAGNFQFENVFNGVDRGGVGNDPLLARAQRGAWFDQANGAFISVSPQDGLSPAIFMFLWNGPDPDRDGDLDAEIILHEYTHGLSSRRVGGGVGLSATQSRGLGEGWSDFMALALLSESPDALGGNYAMGGYSTYQYLALEENYYYGIRRYPYSTNLSKNPLTFKDIDSTQADPHAGIPRSPVVGGLAHEVHNQGEVWCAALWEVRATLIGALGFGDGNQLAVQLVVDGMNLAPPNPTFIQARDAILQAEQVGGTGGFYQTILWSAFAKRGLGYSAAAPASWSPFGVVEAFDLPTPGGELWTYQAGNAVYSSPAVGPDGTIYFGSSDGKLYALNRDGTKKWEFAGGTNGSGGLHPFHSSPAVGPDGAIYIGSYDKKLYAVNPTGTLKWSFTAVDVIFPSPAIGADGAVYFGSYQGKVYALNSDGTLRWQFQAGSSIGIGSSPALDKDGVIYIGSYDNKLYAINPNGSQKWAITVGDWVASSPALDWTSGGVNPANGIVYFGSYDGYVYSVNTQDGSLRWQFLTEGRIVSSPVLDTQGNVYVGSEDGKLYSLAPDGSLRWSFQTGDIIYSSPAIGWDGRVYIGSYDRTLYVLGTDGSLLNSYLLGGDIYSSPVIGSDGRLYVGCSDSKLYAFPAETQLAPSPWPMFRNDARHLGNHGFVWFDSGWISPDGAFHATLRSSITPFPYGTFFDPNNRLTFEWSNTLTNWNLPRSPIIGTGEGVAYLNDVAAIGHSRYFYRARVPAHPLLRSRNPYGFIKVTVPPGASLIANPLSTHDNTLKGLMPTVPEWTELYKFNEVQQNWEIYIFDSEAGGWPDVTLAPGEGAWINNPSDEPFVVTFIGEVLQGYLTRPLPAGYAIASAMVPQNGGITTRLGYGAEDGLATGDRVMQLVNPRLSYVTYVYGSGSGWSRTNPPAGFQLEPQPGYGEAFWIHSLGSRNWKRTVSVWP